MQNVDRTVPARHAPWPLQANALRAWIAGALLGALMVLALMVLVGHAAAATHAAPLELRIGYQKYGTLILLKARGTLDRRLAAQGVTVKWTEFPAGPQLLEGLNVGSIDYGTVGEAPPIFAQAAGAQMVYVGYEPPAPKAEAIVVAANSPIVKISDLKGKRIALNKGSNVHYLLLKVLQQAGLTVADVTPVYLAPADARAAFERGSVDAWAIWDPFLAAAQEQLHVRLLATGDGAVSNHQFYLATRAFAVQHPDLLRIVTEEIAAVDRWGEEHPDQVAHALAPLTGLDESTLAIAAARSSYGVAPLTERVLVQQQQIADAFFDLKLIPHAILVRDATLAPAS